MRAFSLSGLILFFAFAVLLAGQDEIFIDTFEAGSTASWDLDVSRCTQFFTGDSFTDHCYKWLPGTGDWFESQEKCGRWAPGGRLISAETAEEWNHVTLHLIPPNSKSWIGLSRGVRGSCPGAWTWESGEPVSFTNWDPGEPNAVGCPACATSWKDLDDRWDDLACDASGLVSDSVCEVDLATVRIVGEDGGRLVFPNGIVLDVPPDAVDRDMAIGLRSIDCAEIDPFLNARPINSHAKECVAAFDITPSTLTLSKPAILTLPMAHRQADEIPVLLEVFPQESDYAYRPTDLAHDPATASLDLDVSIGGNYAVAVLQPAPTPPPPQTSTVRAEELLCEEGRIHVKSDFVDLDVKYSDVECTLIFDSVSVTFLDCAGQPEFVHEMAESVGCSDKTYFRGRICGPNTSGEECFNDPQPVIYAEPEDRIQLHAWAEAIDPDQGNKRLFIANIDHAAYQWQSLDYSMGRFPNPANGLLETQDCPQETCRFEVQVLNRYVSSPLPKGTVEVVTVIFDVEWLYSWASDNQCIQTGLSSSANVHERHTGTWGGTATFAIPDYDLSEVLSWQLEGEIEYFRDSHISVNCEDPPRVEEWQEIDKRDWNSMARCSQEDFGLYLNENEQDMEFWACMPPVADVYELRRGTTCYGSLDSERNYVEQAVPCLFPYKVALTHQGNGVFETMKTLALEPICGPLPCAESFPVSVFVRAVYRQSSP
jgi:hypothetical protein